MTPSWTEVNAALMAVLADFSRSSRPVSRSSRPSLDVFVDRLFSLRHAEALAESIEEIRIAPGTVVTPMARDYLKRRRVSIRIVSGREAIASRVRASGEWGFAIESRSGTSEAFRRILLDAWTEVGQDSVEAARWVDDETGRGAFVLTDEASIATWRVGRIPGIRAASVVEPEAVSRAIRHLGPNLIVVEPRGKSIYLLKQIADRFREGGAPAIPDGLLDMGLTASRSGRLS
ncbi:hypothetical protein P12x_004288 [Tundrisphaera lichenicola]|uniref:hypothetical protein n=1 Tax=Tundrisphaera lichenicola TaxID=2029860 RepID=UPI003EBAE319